MDGLEAVEMKLSEVVVDNENRRLDSEYFKKNLMSFLNHLDNLKPLGTFVKNGYRVVYENTRIIEHQVGLKENLPFFLQATDLQTPFINTENLFYVDIKEWLRYPMGRITKGEVLIEVKGKAEKVSIVPDDFPERTLVSGTLYKLTVNEKINKYYLLVYLISKYGEGFKNRYKSNLLISYINKDDLYRIPIPVYSYEFQKKVERIYREISKAHNESQSLYKQAERLLLDELKFLNWQPAEDNTEVKSFKNSFLESGRLDAEYYQPKYDELTEKIQQKEHSFLKELVFIKKSIEPGSDAYQQEGIPFIRVANLSKFGLTEPDIHLSTNEVENIQSLFPKKDTILLTKDGSVGIAYKVDKDLTGVTSGAILHLTVKSKKINPDYLTLVLNSVLTKLQAERDAGGSIIQQWRMNEIEKVLIPVIEINKQEEIAQLIQQSFQLKQQSQQLLEAAKQAVEIAIEDGEDKAMEFIQTSWV